MAKRYKGVKTLNRMIDKLENTVITVDIDTGVVITPTIVTKKSISKLYSNVIDEKTGRFLTFEQSKQKVFKATGKKLSYKEYINSLHDFQNSPLYKQLTYRGEKEYQLYRGTKIFGEEALNLIIKEVGYNNYRLIIDRIGRLSNYFKATRSNYDSNTFYDLFQIYLEEVENGVSPLDALNMLEDLF